MAPVLLPLLGVLALSTTGCLNVLFGQDFEPPVDHAPVVTGLIPAPTFEPVGEIVGPSCAPQNTFRAEAVDDADGDTLTVRWSVVVDFSDDGLGGNVVRAVLDESQLDPLDPPVDGKTYDFQPFQLDLATVQRAGLTKDILTGQQKDRTQLLELAVSDGGLKVGAELPQQKDKLVSYFSWQLKLTFQDCTLP